MSFPATTTRSGSRLEAALHRALGEHGWALFEEWSQKSPKFNQAECRYKWTNGLASVKEFGLGTIFWYADKAKPDWRPQTKIVIRATPYVHVEASLLPRRRWEYKPSYIRQFTSMVVATSKVGKSSLLIAEALACVSHRALLGIMPSAPLRVWYWNGEDPREEVERHVAAAMKYYDLTQDDISDRLFVDSGRTMPIVIAEMERYGTRIAEPVVNGVIATIRENNIDALIIDPFVSSHHVNENDNIAIERVAKQWAHIAEETNCCVRYAHHSRKTGGEAVTGESQRGASSNYAAVRSVDTLNYMTEKEAEDAGIEVGRRKYFFRQDYDSNLLPPAEVTTWYEKVSVDLLNAPHPEDSDKIGVVVPWSYPQVKAEAAPDDIERILTAIKEGGPWRRNIQTWKTDWVGIPVARVLGIDIINSKKERKRVGKIVEGLIAKRHLRVTPGKGGTRGRPSPTVTASAF